MESIGSNAIAQMHKVPKVWGFTHTVGTPSKFRTQFGGD